MPMRVPLIVVIHRNTENTVVLYIVHTCTTLDLSPGEILFMAKKGVSEVSDENFPENFVFRPVK